MYQSEYQINNNTDASDAADGQDDNDDDDSNKTPTNDPSKVNRA